MARVGCNTTGQVANVGMVIRLSPVPTLANPVTKGEIMSGLPDNAGPLDRAQSVFLLADSLGTVFFHATQLQWWLTNGPVWNTIEADFRCFSDLLSSLGDFLESPPHGTEELCDELRKTGVIANQIEANINVLDGSEALTTTTCIWPSGESPTSQGPGVPVFELWQRLSWELFQVANNGKRLVGEAAPKIIENEQAAAQDSFSPEVAKIGDREAVEGPKLIVRFVKGGTFGKRSCDPGEVWPVEKERAITLLFHSPPIVELATPDELKADRQLVEAIKGIKKRRDQMGVPIDVPRKLVVRYLRQGGHPLGHSCEPGEVWEVDEEAAYGLLRGSSPLCELATEAELKIFRDGIGAKPESGRTTKQPSQRKRGRPEGSVTSDPTADAMIAKEWRGGHGKFKTHEALAAELQKPVEEVKAALKRDASRKKHSK